MKNEYIINTGNNQQKFTGSRSPLSLPLEMGDISFLKLNKTIEIVTVPKLANKTANQKNIAIRLDEKLIFKILSDHYQNVTITEINTLNDLNDLITRKPDLVFS